MVRSVCVFDRFGMLPADRIIDAGKRLWLRPGKRYLFGRTVLERGSYDLIPSSQEHEIY